jgi:hypothetical protein
MRGSAPLFTALLAAIAIGEHLKQLAQPPHCAVHIEQSQIEVGVAGQELDRALALAVAMTIRTGQDKVLLRDRAVPGAGLLVIAAIIAWCQEVAPFDIERGESGVTARTGNNCPTWLQTSYARRLMSSCLEGRQPLWRPRMPQELFQ